MQLKKGFFFSISVDSTPDIFARRSTYFHNPLSSAYRISCAVFAIYTHVKYTGKDSAATVHNFLEKMKNPILDYLGHSYDNASNMSVNIMEHNRLLKRMSCS